MRKKKFKECTYMYIRTTLNKINKYTARVREDDLFSFYLY